ncbi:hypothetical protein M0R45_030757 [Rubus argutus]|uniref:RNA polymerase Rpb5 N-terminal domain-containing protein n=1 Tax=Rubus argutus TaxID=59490 RepID=A0AAW1WEL6_RUBAR
MGAVKHGMPREKVHGVLWGESREGVSREGVRESGEQRVSELRRKSEIELERRIRVEGDNGEERILGPCLSGYVDDGSTESHRYYLSRRTVLEMLRDRGYSVPSSEIDLSLQDFRALHGQNPDVERLRFSATHTSDPSERILVIYCGPGIVKVNVIRGLHGQIANRTL